MAVTAGDSAKRRIGYEFQSRLVTFVFENVTSSFRMRLAACTSWPLIWFSTAAGFTTRPASMAPYRCVATTMPVFLLTVISAVAAPYDDMCVPRPMPRPVTTLPFDRAAGPTLGAQREAVATAPRTAS